MAPKDKDASKAVYLTCNLPVSSFNPSMISLSLRTASGPMLGKIPKILRVTIVNTSNRNAVKGKAMCLNRGENLERVDKMRKERKRKKLGRKEQEMLDRAERRTGKRKVEKRKSVLKKEEKRRKEAEEQKKKEEEEKRKKEGLVSKRER